MGLAEELYAGDGRPRSQIEKAIEQLEGADRADFITALNDTKVSPATIERVMLKRGIFVDARRISEYRKNGGRVRYGLDGQRVSR